MQQSKHKETLSSGSFELPTVLAYPEVLTLEQVPEIKGQFIYVIEDYGDNGLAIMIKRQDGVVHVGIGDWDGNHVEYEDDNHPLSIAAVDFATNHARNFIEMMKILKIDQIMVYIAIKPDGWCLVDLRASLDKFYGPGMVKDLFSSIFPTQKIHKIVSLDESVLETIGKNTGSYHGDLILKCSKFKTIVREKRMLPLYARVKR